jgi:hypothetical protein
MSNPPSGTNSPPIHVPDLRLQSRDLDHVDIALAALQVKDAAATHLPTHGARSSSFGAFGAGGRL